MDTTNGASDGGDGTWDTTTTNWDGAAWDNANNDIATFGGTAGTVTLGESITVGGLQFDTAGYLIQDNGGGETLTFGTVGNITANQNAEISATLAGSAAITKTGSGALTLSGDNTFTGDLTINDGEVVLGNAGALNDTSGSENSVTVASGATLSLNGNSIVVPTLSGTGIIQNANATAATLTIHDTTTFAGTLQDGSGGGALGLIKTGTGTLTLSGNNSFSGGVTIKEGTLDFDTTASGNGIDITADNGNQVKLFAANGLSGGDLSVSNGSDILIDGTNSLSFSSATGSGTITYGNGAKNKTLTILDASTFTGDLFNYGTYNGDRTIQFQSLGDSAGAGNIQFGGPGSLDNNQSGTFRLYGDSGALILNNRQIEILEPTSKNAFRYNRLENNNTNPENKWVINTDFINRVSGKDIELWLQGSNTGDNEFHGAVSDSLSNDRKTKLFKGGTGKWILSGDNTYTGDTTIANGTLVVGGSGVLGGGNYAGAISIGAGDTLTFSSTVDQVLSGTIASIDANGKLNFSGSGLVSITGDATGFHGTINATGPVDLKGAMGAKAITVGDNGVLDIVKGDVGTLTLADASSLTFGDGSTWNIDIASATSFDKIISNNSTIVLPAEGQISINVNLFGKAKYLQTYTIFDGDLAGAAFTPSMFVLPEGWGITEGSLILISYIPEPSTAILAALGLAGLCLRRRRR
ncbi:MAG: autotransporter-associated beta strand repeat-containing protein [Lentisphaeria bacterium]|nr:autotransporter-associated beta strand repeat-containing protein [Lentisphaeria bacterium]